MPPRVAIIDYQMSNLFSVEHACNSVGLNAKLTTSPSELLHADAAILPGVGAFADAMANLNTLGMTDAIRKFIQSGKPFMGICLGLQLLFTTSYEFGTHEGLNVVPGTVVRFPLPANAPAFKIPQIGWNTIHKPEGSDRWGQSPLQNVRNGAYMYFVHSYIVQPDRAEDCITRTTYEGVDYCSGVLHDNVFAVQFHPEKSGPEGMKIYKSWATSISH